MAESSDAPLLTLDFDNRKLRVAGEELAGTVSLNFKELQRRELDEVTLRLMGATFTYVVSPSPPIHRPDFDIHILQCYHGPLGRPK